MTIPHWQSMNFWRTDFVLYTKSVQFNRFIDFLKCVFFVCSNKIEAKTDIGNLENKKQKAAHINRCALLSALKADLT